MDIHLNSKIEQLNKVGKALATRLRKLNIFSVQDVLFYFPSRYEDYRGVLLIKDIKEGQAVSVRAKVQIIANRRSFRRRGNITEALISDDSGSMRVVWFNQPYLAKTIKQGAEYIFSGVVKTDMVGPQFVCPSFEKASLQTTHTARIVPMYALTTGITHKQMRFLVSQCLPILKSIEDYLPGHIVRKFGFPSIQTAVKNAHFPSDENILKISLNRLKFDELFILQMKAEMSRAQRMGTKAPRMKFYADEVKRFVADLPFQLTKTQKVSAWEILKDIQNGSPMNRMLSGDVGSGKTVVCAIAMYDVALNKGQSALLAPTEILAKQHFDTITKMFSKNDVKIALYTRSQRETNFFKNDIELSKKEISEIIASGSADIVIGTHAILSDKMEFKNLCFAIVDEQHRFGVEQRKTIRKKGEGAHFLSMTATPIPRSLALLAYGDLDLSQISEMPLGRKPIKTRLVEQFNRQAAYDFIRTQIKNGRQAFVICPLIEDETDEKKSVMKEYEHLSKEIFPDLRVGFLHGKLKSEEKESVMQKFSARGGGKYELDVLVSTSVVEVGVDIPNAGVMMIEGAEHFGLAQLHQFRGRVGRAEHQSYCLLFTNTTSEKSLERLKFFEKHTNGFKLAEKDLETRGPGEVYGTVQSGEGRLKLAKITDVEVIKQAREVAVEVAKDLEKYPALKQKLQDFEQKVHLE